MDKRGDWIKDIEMQEAGRKMVLDLPVIARLDGRAFHTFTRGMRRPYDENFSSLMQETTKDLVKEFHADVGYTQSDEITLIWKKPIHFDGRYQKLTSVLAGYASAAFAVNKLFFLASDEYQRQRSMTACFDCRVFQVASLDNAVDILAWREEDATKNSVAMAAQSMFSHKELHKKNRVDMMNMMHAKGVNWNDYPDFFKRGTYFQRVNVEKLLTPTELARIPEKHRPTGPVVRGEVVDMKLNPINSYLRVFLMIRFGWADRLNRALELAELDNCLSK